MQRPRWPRTRELVELAFDATSRGEFRSQVLRRLVDATGSDYGVFSGVATPPEAEELLHLDKGLAEASRQTLLEGAPSIDRALRLLHEHGALVDTDAYSPKEWERLPYVDRFQRGLGIKSNLILSWVDRAGETIVVTLARTRRRFGEEDRHAAARVFKALAVADGSFGSRGVEGAKESMPGLSDRQREILGYVCRGYSNAEIARACGISPFTVRNHLVKLFERYRVATRTELALLVTDRL